MNLHEYQAKKLFADYGLPVSEGYAVDTADQAVEAAEKIGVSPDELRSTAQERIPMGRFLEPEEVAHIAVYLAADESDGMTGQTITISGGMRMA